MWAKRYWANRYWARRHWSDAGTAEFGTQLFIDGVNRNSLLKLPSLAWTDKQENRGPAEFTLVVPGPPPYFRPCVGDPVAIRFNDGLVWSGTIEDFDENEPVINTGIFYKVRATDHAAILDRFLVVKIYDNILAGDIIKDMITTFVPSVEGIDTANVSDGLLIERIVYNHRKVSDCIRELSKLVGFSWYVDQNKKLFFEDRASVAAPFGLSVGSKNYRKLDIKRKRMQYRNVQFLLAGDDTTDLRAEDFAGDGDRQTFTLGFRVAEEPTITLNAGAQTVGIRGVDDETAFDWFWRKDDKEITQAPGDAAIISTDTLQVTYRGLFPLGVVREDAGEILNRIGVEGNSGVYQNVEDDDSIEKRPFAVQKADGLIDRWGNIPTTAKFETDDVGLRAGQLIPINLPDRGADMVGNFLIDEVKTKAIAAFKNTTIGMVVLRHTVSILSGKHLGSWVSFYRKLQDAGRRLKLREGETLLIIRNLTEGIDLADAFNTVDALAAFTADPYTCFQWGSAVEDRAFWGREFAVGVEISGSQFCNPPVDA